MGFYGNITHGSTTNLTFDRTYGNKFALDASMNADNIYLGRYALVEYDVNDIASNLYKEFYYLPTYNYLYTEPVARDDASKRVFFTTSNFDKLYPSQGVAGSAILGQIVKVKVDGGYDLYKCYSSVTDKDTHQIFAVFQLFSPVTESNYMRNQRIDNDKYPNSERGYDSTVWQKVYDQANNRETYVNIANLNSVIPTFDIVADAPTMIPSSPHFDKNSGGVHYTLHMQPQWGMRVAEASDPKYSDQSVAWIKEEYNSNTGKTQKKYYNYDSKSWENYSGEITSDMTKVPGNIFLNAAAFDPQTEKAAANINKALPQDDPHNVNYISIVPTGVSGNQYTQHDGSVVTSTAPDIYEMSISLPVIGNTISKVWDTIYGEDRKSGVGSLQGRITTVEQKISGLENLETQELIPIKQNISNLSESLSNETKDRKDSQEELLKKIDTINSNFSSVENSIQELENKDNELNSQISELKTISDDLSFYQTTITAELEETNKTILSLDNNLTSTKTDIELLKGKVQTLENKVLEIDNRLKDFLNSFEEKLDSLELKISAYESFEERIQNLESRFSE